MIKISQRLQVQESDFPLWFFSTPPHPPTPAILFFFVFCIILLVILFESGQTIFKIMQIRYFSLISLSTCLSVYMLESH